ncbi:MAG: sugar ABC transporter substrate-binding protein [Candidatus Sericytochromatia bacterium]|nr:sugar ABC transporter substrate-binding protein [Candidatus Sericytochromatia bacterium]
MKLLWGLVLGLGLLTGCSSGPEPLTFWAMGQEGERVEPILAPFRKSHPEIQLKIQTIPWGAAHDKLLTAFAGQSTPDVCQMGNTWIPELASVNALRPLDDFLAGTPSIAPADYFEGIWHANHVDKQLFGLPWYVDTRALYYRKDLLAQAGFQSPPATWAEWAHMAKVLTIDRNGDGQPERYGVTLPANPSGVTVPLFLAWQNGGDLVNATATEATVTSPAFIEAVSFYAEFFRVQSSPREVGGLTNFQQAFVDGAFAMFISGPWDAQGLHERHPEMDGKWAVAPLPAKKLGGSRASMAGGSSLVIFRASKKADEAWKLIEYLSQPDVQAKFHAATADLPARRSAWQLAGLSAKPEAMAFFAQLQDTRPVPSVPEWEQLADKLGIWTEKVVYGRMPADQAMTSLQAEMNQILSKRRWLLSRPAKPAMTSSAETRPR